MKSTAYALGIDVGSTATAAATFRDGQVDVLTLSDHSASMPSLVYRRDDGEFLVGHAARRRAATDPTRVASEFKRYLGSDVPVVLGSATVSVEELFAVLIREAVRVATERQAGPPAHVTLSCPAEWGEARRARLHDAAARAGVGDAGLLAEPVAAATHYASIQHGERLAPGTLLAVYDFGGATFDAALVEKTGDALSLRGRPAGDDIGGFDLDQAVLGHVQRTLGADWPASSSDDATLAAVLAMRTDVTDRKEALSDDVEVAIPVNLPTVHRSIRLTRAEFEDLVSPLVQRTIDLLGGVFADAGVTPERVERLLLIGGSSRIPLVTQRLRETYPHIALHLDDHPKFAVCFGAALAAGARMPRPRSVETRPIVARESLPPRRPAVFVEVPTARTAAESDDAVPRSASFAVDLVARGLDGLRDEIVLRPAADLRLRRPAVAVPQIAAELGPAESDGPATSRVMTGIALVLVLVVAALVVLILVAR